MVIPMAETGESVSPFVVGEMTRQLRHLSRNLDAINNYNRPYRDSCNTFLPIVVCNHGGNLPFFTGRSSAGDCMRCQRAAGKPHGA